MTYDVKSLYSIDILSEFFLAHGHILTFGIFDNNHKKIIVLIIITSILFTYCVYSIS